MSTTVDQRVVEMKFDNRQFESGVRESMSTLDKLKQALNFKKTATGLEDISKEVSKIDMSGLAKATETVASKFTALDVIAVTTLVRITNAAISAGTALVKSLSIDQLTAGWAKYEEKTTAVQTIMSATRMQFEDEAKQLEVINAKLRELNWFTDETSYNFTDMVSNIGKFTSAGVDLDTAAKSMQGIATWAAMSGANAVTASRAMYNLAQAIGVGYVKLMDWKTIENCNMATMEFKQTVLETAVELGTLKKEADGVYKTVARGTKVTAEAFSESLSEGWFTNDVLTSSLNVYEKATDKLHEMADKYEITATEILSAFDEYKESAGNIGKITEELGLSDKAAKEFAADLDILNSEEYELSISAFKAAQQAKTFTDVIDATKDAVSTGWMQTFEYIFGNYHEAVELFSDLCEVFWELFASGAEARNSMLELWKSVGGRESLLRGIYKAFDNIGKVLDAVKEGWNDLFGKETWAKAAGLLKVTHYLEALFHWLEPTERELTNIKDTFKGLFSILDLVGTVLKSILKAIFPMINPARGILDIVLEITGAIGRLISGNVKLMKIAIESTDIFSVIISILKKIINVVINVILVIVRFLNNIGIAEKASKVFTVVINALVIVFDKLGTAVTFAIKCVSVFIGILKDIITTIATSFTKVVNSGANTFRTATMGARSACDSFTRSLEKVPAVKSVFERIAAVLSVLKERFNAIASKDGKLAAFFDGLATVAKYAASALGSLISLLIETVKKVNPARVALIALAASLSYALFGIGKAAKGIGGVTSSVSGLLDTLKDRLKKPRIIKVSILEIAAAIAVLTASLYVIANGIDERKLWSSVAVIAALSAILLTLAVASAMLSKTLAKAAGDKTALISVGTGVLELSASVLVLTKAMQMLNEVKLEGIWQRLGILATISVGLAGIAVILSKASPKMSKSAFVLLSFAISIHSVVSALTKLTEISRSPEELEKMTVSLIELMAGLSMLAFASRSISLFSAVGLVALVLTFKMVLPILVELSNYDYTSIEKAIENNLYLTVALITLSIAMTIVGGLLGKGLKNFAKGAILMVVAIALLVQVMKTAQELNPDNLKTALIAVGSCVGMFALLEVLSKFTIFSKPIPFAAAMMILSIAVSILVDVSKKLAETDTEGILVGVGSVIALLGMVAVLELLSSKAGELKGLSKLLVTISILAVEMSLISMLPWKDILAASISMGITMLAFGKSVEMMTKHRAWGKDATKTILGITATAAACSVLGLAMSVLSTMNWKSILASGVTMSIVITIFGNTLESISKLNGFNKTDRCIKRLASAITVLSFLSIFGYAMSQLAKNDWISIILSATAMNVSMVLFGKTLQILSKMSIKKGLYTTILATSLELLSIGLTMKLIADISWLGIFKGLAACALALGYLIGVNKLAAKFKGKIDLDLYKNILAFSAVIGALGFALKLLAENANWKDSLAASIGTAAVLWAVVRYLIPAIEYFSEKIGKAREKIKKEVNPKTFKDLLSTAAVIAAIGAAIGLIAHAFKTIDATVNSEIRGGSNSTLESLLILAGLGGLLIIFMKIAKKVADEYSVESMLVILTIAAGILAIAMAFSLISGLEFGDIAAGLGAMLVVLAMFRLCVITANDSVFLSFNVIPFQNILAFAGLMFSIATSLWILSNVGWLDIKKGLKAIGLCLAELAAVLVVISAVSYFIGSIPLIEKNILAMTGVLLGISIALNAMAGISKDPKALKRSMYALKESLKIVVELCALLGVIAYFAPAVGTAAAAITGPILACAASMFMLSFLDPEKMANGLEGLLGAAMVLVLAVALLAAIGPIASITLPGLAGALLTFSVSLLALAFLDWNKIYDNFMTFLKIVGMITGIVVAFAALTHFAMPVMLFIMAVLEIIVELVQVFVLVSVEISAATALFGGAVILLAAAFKLLETVNWDIIVDGIGKIFLPLMELAVAMLAFTAGILGVPLLLIAAAALKTLNALDFDSLSIGLIKASDAIDSFRESLNGFSLGGVNALALTASILKGLADTNLKPLGKGLQSAANGLILLSKAIQEYSSGDVDIISVTNDMMTAASGIQKVAEEYESAAARIEKANGRILLSSTLLGLFLNEGLISGLLGSAKGVYDTTADIGEGTLDAYADSTGIASPSKLMARMGSFLMQGVAIGAVNESPTVYRTMGEIGANTIKAAAISNEKFAEVGADAIKSQSKGMAAASEGAVRTITDINKTILKADAEQNIESKYKTGYTSEIARAEGIAEAAPTTAKAIGHISSDLISGEQKAYHAGYAKVGKIASDSCAVSMAEEEDTNASVYAAAGTQQATNWYTGFKGIISSAWNDLNSGFASWQSDLSAQIGDTEGAKIWSEMASEYAEKAAASGGKGILSGLSDTVSDLTADITEGFKFDATDFFNMDNYLHDLEYGTVLWGKTEEWQEKYKAAMDAGDTALMEQLAREAGTMVEMSKYSEEYYRITGEGYGAMYDMSNVTESLNEALSNLGNTTGMTGDEVDEFAQSMKTLHDTIEGQISAWSEFDRTIDITSYDILHNLQSQISGVNEWSNKLLVLAQRGISNGILKELAEMGPQGYKYVEAFIQMTGDELATVNDLWIEKGTLSASSTLAIQAAYALAGDEASKAYIEGLGVNLEQIQDAAQQLGDSLAIEATPEALKAIDAYKETFNSLYDSIESSINIFEKFNMETETSSEEMLENMKSQIEGITQWSENLKKLGERGISDGLLKQLSDLGPDGYDKVNAFVEMTDSQLQEANDLYAQSLELPSEATANILSGYAQAGDESAQAFIEALGASVSDVSSIGTYILEGLKLGLFDSEATQQLTTTAYNVGDSIIQQLMLATDSHSPSVEAYNIGKWVDIGLKNGINDKAGIPKDAARNMGNSMLNGLVEGINNGSSRVIESMVSVAKNAIEAAKSVLDINSPSRVFAQIGKYVDEGFAQGIDQNASMVEAPIEKMGNASIDTLKNALTHARDIINGDIDNTITLTPVLDLSNVRAGVQQINGMMNSASVSANATVEGSDESGKNQNGGMTFIQNNYSPKALNRIDIYRQTKNQFAAMKGLVSGT